MSNASTAPPDRLCHVLGHGDITLEGRLLTASNATFVGVASLGDDHVGCVYKPVRGEHPLWDFPDGTLAARERASYCVSEATGWGLVPLTVLRDGPFGPGMVQRWIVGPEEAEDDPPQPSVEPATDLVDVVPLGAVPEGWRHVLDAEDQRRTPVTLVHADHPALRRMAVLDAVLNNADRKGGHILHGTDDRVYGVDHGVTFHTDPKLRTVLWGWAGERLPADCLQGLRRIRQALDGELGDQLTELLSPPEWTATAERVAGLLDTGTFPLPSGHWPSIPWPAF